MGVTREIAVQTSESNIAEFVWRVSVADVNSAAPFSSFPGIDRHIVLLEGAGFTMTLDGEGEHMLVTPFVPFAFAGESAVSVALVDGPTRDFNLMVRRANAYGEVVVLREAGLHRLDGSAVLVYVAQGEVETRDGKLQAGDSWRVADADSAVTLGSHAIALAIRIRPNN